MIGSAKYEILSEAAPTAGWFAILVKKEPVTRAQLEQLDDGRLVALTLSGNSKAYEAIIRRYQKLVYNVLYQMLRNHETAAETTQETFLKAFRSLGSFKQEARFKPWLLRIATNTGLNLIRDSKNRDFDSLDAVLGENPAAEPASSENIEDVVERQFTQAMLQEALATLPGRHRHVFLLRYQHDLSYADIASVVDEPETTIKSLLFRIREKLRKLLSEKMISA